MYNNNSKMILEMESGKINNSKIFSTFEFKKYLNDSNFNSNNNFINNFVQKNREEQFINPYLYNYEQNLINKEPDLENLFSIHHLYKSSRGKMIDWLIEVFNNFSPDGYDYTYFRTILIMDLFLKYSIKSIKNEDILILGLTSLIIASKLEDIYQIQLDDLLKYAAKNKFNINQILDYEKLILNSIGYICTLPTPLTFLDFYITKNFVVDKSEFFYFNKRRNISKSFSYIKQETQNIKISNILELRLISIYILRLIILENEFFEYGFKNLTLSVIIFSIKTLYESYIHQEFQNLSNVEKEEIIKEQKEIIKNIERNNEINNFHLKKILNHIENYMSNIDIKFEYIKNLKDINSFKNTKNYILENN